MKLEGELLKFLSFVIFRDRHFEKKTWRVQAWSFSSRHNHKLQDVGVAIIMVGLNVKIVNNATGTIFVAATNGHDWQPYWILRPLSKI